MPKSKPSSAPAATTLGPRSRAAAGTVKPDTDPYALWAEARNFRGFSAPWPVKASKRPWRQMSCVVELDADALRNSTKPADWPKVLRAECKARVPSAFHDLPLDFPERIYATVVVRTDHYYSLQSHRFVKRLVLSLPRAGRGRRFESLAQAGAAGAFSGPKAGSAQRGVLAVIDAGLPILSQDFGDRVQYSWDQDVGTLEPHGHESPRLRAPSRLAWPWRTPCDFGYGRELTLKDLQDLRASRAAAKQPNDEASLYAALLYPAKPEPGRQARRDQPRAAWALPESTHGAQCAGVAAAPRLGAPGDEASQADLIFVQLPSETVADSSGGGLATYALDALRYVVERTDPEAPLVVNLSYGAAAGPHDGTSILESAIAQLVASRPGMVVVVPAGNLHAEEGELMADERRLHARLRLAAGETRSLTWCLPSGSEGDHCMELWPRGASAEGLKIILDAPSGDRVHAAQGGVAFHAEDGVVRFGVVHCAQSPLGLHPGNAAAPMALLAVSSDATAGRWTVTLSNSGAAPLDIDAWIERADPLFGRNSLQSHFARDEPASSRWSTLSTLANSTSVLVAGGMAGQGAGAQVASYSSSGPALAPSTRLGPDISTWCEENLTTPYRMVPGFRSRSWVAGNGTSLAAPAVARWALQMLGTDAGPLRTAKGPDLISELVALLTKAASTNERCGRVI